MQNAILSTSVAVGTLLAGTILSPLSAHAALVSAGSPTCSVTNLTVNATSCSGAWQGNQNNQLTDVLAQLGTLSGLSGWGLVGHSDTANNGPFTGNPQVTNGTLTFDAPQSGPFAIALKASNQFSLYFFDGSKTNISNLGFITNGVSLNKNGIPQDLSHASLYTSSATTAVPTPALLPGLVGLGMTMMRKRKGAVAEKTI